MINDQQQPDYVAGVVSNTSIIFRKGPLPPPADAWVFDFCIEMQKPRAQYTNCRVLLFTRSFPKALLGLY